MSLLSSRPALRWALPAGVLAAALAAGGLGSVISANAEPALPKRSAAQLLVDLQNATVEHFSGTIVQKADLGLPSMPQAGSQGSSNLSSLVSGSHTVRVWYAGPEKARFALLGTLGESDVIRNKKDLWVWSSDHHSATHYTIPDEAGDKELRPPQQPLTPNDAADQLLKAIDPSTKVTTDGTAKVAGRSAYELVVAPRDKASRIGQVRLAIDAEQHVPLQVQVFAKGFGSPSFEVRFEQVSFAKPSDEQFTFTAPKGTTVTEGKLFGTEGVIPTPPELPATPEKAPGAPKKAPGAPDKAPGGTGGPTVIGKGWTAVVVFHGADLPAAVPEREVGGAADPFGQMLAAMPKVSGAWGSGTLLKSNLFCALLTDDGRLLVGAVSPEQLYAAAADPAAKAPR